MAKGGFSIEIEGLKELNTLLAKLPAQTAQAVGKQLYQLGNEIMTASKEQVPVDLGALRASGQVGLPEISGDQVSVTLGYGDTAGGNGDTAVSYAIPVHERLDVYHKPPTGAKYLERPVLEAVERLAKAAAQGTRDAAEESAA